MSSSSFAGVLPGARVRNEHGFIGTVERLEHHWATADERPDRMIVRSDDGRWRYSIPLMFVRSLSQGAFHPIVLVALQEDELLHYLVQEVPSSRSARAIARQMGNNSEEEPDSDPEVLRVPLAEEELVAHKEPVQLGMAHVHKGVEAADASAVVSLYHEEVAIEHIPADQFDPAAEKNPNVVIVPVVEERLVVRREQVVTEYIRVCKRLVAEQRELQGLVRREYVTVTEDAREGQPPKTLFDSRESAVPLDPWEMLPGDEPAADQPDAAAADAAEPA
jgi:uncharacterized protein (TIGR02271 family)